MINGVLITVKTKPVFFKGLNGHTSFDPQLYGSYLTAIDSFAKVLSQDRIQAILLGDTLLIYRLLDESVNILLIVIADRNIKKVKVKQFIDDLEEAFFNVFRVDQVIRHSSEPNYFIPFEAALNIIHFKNMGQVAF